MKTKMGVHELFISMTCLGPYEFINFFLTLCFIVTKFCVLASNYLNAYKQYLFILTVAYEMPQKCCVVYLNFTDYQMKP